MAIHPIYQTRHGLTPAAREVLEVGQYAVLGTENDDGSVHLAPVMYGFDEDSFLVETSAATRKARNVAARGRATVLVLDPRADNTAWVSGSGPARLLHGSEAHDAGRRLRSRYLTDVGEEEVGTVFARYDDVVITVSPDRWLAWDMTALNDTLVEHGVSLDRADLWYQPVGA